jgi:hypothetical protein
MQESLAATPATRTRDLPPRRRLHDIARWRQMRPDVALTWPFSRPAVLGVAWFLRSLAPSLAPRRAC